MSMFEPQGAPALQRTGQRLRIGQRQRVLGGVLLRVLGSGLLGSVLFGCSSGPLLFFTDREEEYQTAANLPPLKLPSDLRGTHIKSIMVVPDLPPESVANAALEAIDPRPTSLLNTGEGDYIKIQKLGNRHWLVIDEPPAVVWPRAKQFLVANRITIVREDASSGWLETDWIPLDALSQDSVRSSLRTAAASATAAPAAASAAGAAPRTSTSAKLFMRVEPGVRDGTAEVHFRESESLIATSTWPDTSAMADVEDLLLKAIGERLAQAGGDAAAVSLRAQQLQTVPKSKLERGAGGRPQLTMNLDFDRAWATVNQALSKAELNITDVNREKGILYLKVSEADLRGEEDGFFTRWFFSEDHHALQLRLQGTDVHYALMVDAEPGVELPPAFPEQLLTLIRNHAG